MGRKSGQIESIRAQVLRARQERTILISRCQEGSLKEFMLLCAWHASCPTRHGTMLATYTKMAAGTAGLATLRWGLLARHRPTASWRTRLLTRLGAAGVTLAMLVQVMGLCLCVTRALAPTDPHACCPRPAPKPGESAAPAASFSMTDHTRDCCPTGLHARTVVRLNEREPLPPPAAYAVSSAASFTTLADQATAFGGTTRASARTSSPPRSPVLRI